MASSGETRKSLRRVTISDVATAAGVSRTTVSYVLSNRVGARVPEGTRARVLQAAQHTGYQRNALAVAFRSGRMNTVGIVAPYSLICATPNTAGAVYYKDLVLHLAAAGFAGGMNSLLLSEDENHPLSLRDVADRRADGVIVVVKADANYFVDAARLASVPCVTVGSYMSNWQVQADDLLGARLAVGHLRKLGHERIAFYWYGKDKVLSARARRDGFLREMADCIAENSTNALIFTDRETDALFDALRKPDAPTAVFCYNDELAMSLMEVVQQRGLVIPDDLSVVGYDDTIIAYCMQPGLTTVHNPLQEIAKTAIEMLQSQMAGGAAPGHPVLVTPTLTIRQSTAPPRTLLRTQHL